MPYLSHYWIFHFPAPTHHNHHHCCHHSTICIANPPAVQSCLASRCSPQANLPLSPKLSSPSPICSQRFSVNSFAAVVSNYFICPPLLPTIEKNGLWSLHSVTHHYYCNGSAQGTYIRIPKGSSITKMGWPKQQPQAPPLWHKNSYCCSSSCLQHHQGVLCPWSSNCRPAPRLPVIACLGGGCESE